jgi:phage terminase small subunit
MPALTDPRREAFAQHYALNGHSTRAAREAGYSGNAWHIANDPTVQSRVSEIVGRRFAKASITADRVVMELARIAFSDIRDLYDDEGNLLPPQDLPDDVAAIISRIKVELKGQGRGEDRTVAAVLDIKMADKLGALTILAKHFKIIGDEADGVNAIANILSERLNSARARDLAHAFQDADDARIIDHAAEPLEGVRLTYTLPGESSSGEDMLQAPPADPVPHQGEDDEERLW